MTNASTVRSDFSFGSSGISSTNLDGVEVTMKASAVGFNGHGLTGPKPAYAGRGRVELTFSQPIRRFSLGVSRARNDELINGFNIGNPDTITGNMVRTYQGVTTSLPFPADAGCGILVWEHINSDKVCFDLCSAGQSALVLNDFSFTLESNAKPTAVIGGETSNLDTGDIVSLTGNGSYDPEDDALSYHWDMLEQPSNAGLESADGMSFQFRAAVAGRYVIGLTVNDGVNQSEQVTRAFEVAKDHCTGRPSGLLLEVGADGFARSEYIVLKNGSHDEADLSGVIVEVPTAQKRAQKHSRYTFEQGFVLGAGDEVRIQVYPSDTPCIRSFGCKLPMLHDEKRCLVNVIHTGKVVASSLVE